LRRSPDLVATPLPLDTRKTDPDLALVIERWSALPEAVRAGITAMVRAACGGAVAREAPRSDALGGRQSGPSRDGLGTGGPTAVARPDRPGVTGAGIHSIPRIGRETPVTDAIVEADVFPPGVGHRIPRLLLASPCGA
jgi:hypothetical protein